MNKCPNCNFLNRDDKCICDDCGLKMFNKNGTETKKYLEILNKKDGLK